MAKIIFYSEDVKGLNKQQKDKIVQFQDQTAIEDTRLCRNILQKHKWNVKAAVRAQTTRQNLVVTEFPAVISDFITRNLLNQTQLANNEGTGFFEPIFNFISSIYNRVRRIPETLGISNNLVFNAILSVFSIIPNTFRWIFRIQPNSLQNPVSDVLNFIMYFEEQFGNEHPYFHHGTFAKALVDAREQSTFLLVFLHNEDNEESINFCKNVLTNSDVISYIENNALLWACSIITEEGYHVSQTLRESRYPFIAVIAFKDKLMRIIGRLDRILDPKIFLHSLQSIFASNEIDLKELVEDEPSASAN